MTICKLSHQFCRLLHNNDKGKKDGLPAETENLGRVLPRLKGKGSRLYCGHHITLGHFLGKAITILNGKGLKLICCQCPY
jgi:hypothetical protein